jgi:hypothetical protein
MIPAAKLFIVFGYCSVEARHPRIFGLPELQDSKSSQVGSSSCS